MVELQLVIWVSMAIVGFALLVMTSLIGGDSDIGGDLGGDIGGLDAGGMSPLSLPLIAMFLATSGAVGAVMSASGFDGFTTALAAGVVGIASFVGTYFFMQNFLMGAQGSSSYHEAEYEGKTGTVTETITEDGVGAIAVTVRGARAVVSARSDGRRIEAGTEVLVKRVSGSVAHVEELKQT